MPLYSTWFWSPRFITGSGLAFWTIAVPIVLLLTFGAIWLYRSITLANADRKWFRLLFNGIEWTPMLRAMEYLKEIDEFKAR